MFAINPMSVARYRERHSTSGATSDAVDAHVLAEIVRLDRAHHRQVARDSPAVEGLTLVARMHQSLIWERNRHLQRLRSALREFFPAALDAFTAAGIDLAAPDALELLDRAPDPTRAQQLSRSKITRPGPGGDRAPSEATIRRIPQSKESANSLAATLDVLARHLGDVSEGVRWQVVRTSREVLGRRGT